MSHIQNTRWIEAAQEQFEDAVARHDLKTVKAIIADTFDAGFAAEARTMNEEVRKYPASHWEGITSPYQNL